MAYRYFYRVVIKHGNGDPCEILEQLRNEPMTGRMYRDVLRWALATDLDGPRAGWVRADVHVATGMFDSMPVVGARKLWQPDSGAWATVEETLPESQLRLTARITWYPTFFENGVRSIIKCYERWPARWEHPFMRCSYRAYETCHGEVLPDV